MFYLAGKAFAVHTILTIACVGWSFLINQALLGVVFGVLWLLSLVVYIEFRNSV